MKTAVEWIEERLNLSIGDELKSLRGLFVIAKETEKEQIEEAIKNGYAGCCGKKTTVKLKGNFWEREESWDERKSVNEVIVNNKNICPTVESALTSPERRYMIDFVKWITENYEFKDIVIPYEVVDKWEESKT